MNEPSSFTPHGELTPTPRVDRLVKSMDSDRVATWSGRMESMVHLARELERRTIELARRVAELSPSSEKTPTKCAKCDLHHGSFTHEEWENRFAPSAIEPTWKLQSPGIPGRNVAWLDWRSTHVGKMNGKKHYVLELPVVPTDGGTDK